MESHVIRRQLKLGSQLIPVDGRIILVFLEKMVTDAAAEFCPRRRILQGTERGFKCGLPVSELMMAIGQPAAGRENILDPALFRI